jgi:hypothetical protein
MCCFSSPPKAVASTRILSRVDGDRQFIAYEMQFSASKELAMILPIPIVPGCPEDSVNFISLKDYKTLFSDLHSWFNPMPKGRRVMSKPAPRKTAPQLVVHSVGAFEASFVPSIADFTRLDPRFRINAQIWNTWSQYADYGFAVFKLKAGDHQQVHPMAFSFTTRDPSQSFFPTLHIHGEEATSHETFDHDLYLQLREPPSLKPPPPFSAEEIIQANIDRDTTNRVPPPTPPPVSPNPSRTLMDRIEDMTDAVSDFFSSEPVDPPSIDEPMEVEPVKSSDYSHKIRQAPKWRGGLVPPTYAINCSKTGGVMNQSWPTYTIHIGGTFPNRDIWVPSS